MNEATRAFHSISCWEELGKLPSTRKKQRDADGQQDNLNELFRADFVTDQAARDLTGGVNQGEQPVVRPIWDLVSNPLSTITGRAVLNSSLSKRTQCTKTGEDEEDAASSPVFKMYVYIPVQIDGWLGYIHNNTFIS